MNCLKFRTLGEGWANSLPGVAREQHVDRNNPRRRALGPRSCLGTALLLVLLAITPARGESFIVQDGKPRAEIVVSVTPARSVKLAARELQTYLNKISGATLPIVTAPSDETAVRIYVGQSEHTDRLKLSADGLHHGAFRMASGPNHLALLGRDSDFAPKLPFNRHHGDIPRMMAEWDALTGETWGNPRLEVYKRYNKQLDLWEDDGCGSLMAVYEFLRSLGVRWYMPGDLGEIVPRLTSIPLPQIDREVRPDFVLRRHYFAFHHVSSQDGILWYLRLGLNRAGEILGQGPPGHGTTEVHERAETKKAHPEYFALYNGKRDTESFGGGKPCLSSEGLFQSNVRYVRKVFDIYDEPMMSVMPQDGYSFICECELCHGKDTPQRGTGGQLSDYVWDYVNRVAIEVYKTHPNKKILCLAYGPFLLPPLKIEKLSPNVVVGIVHPRAPLSDPAKLRAMDELRQAWRSKITPGQMLAYDHYLHNRPGNVFEGLPVYFPHAIAADMRSLKGNSIGDFIEDSLDPRLDLHAPEVNHLNVYVNARLYWNADLDVDQLLQEYYDNFYGPASKQMKAYIDYAEANWPQMLRDTQPIDKAMALLTEARRAAGDTIYGQRIALLFNYAQPMLRLRERLAQGRGKMPVVRATSWSTAEITLDGKLDDPQWQNLPLYSLADLQTGNPPRNTTTFSVAYAQDALYFAIRCADTDARHLNIAARKPDDGGIWNGDCLELLLESPVHAYYQLVISPNGVLTDLDRKDNAQNMLWSSGAKVVTHMNDQGWTAEIRIPIAGDLQENIDPLHGVAGSKPTLTSPWYFNLCRQRLRDKDTELSAFSPTRQPHFHELMKFGQLVTE